MEKTNLEKALVYFKKAEFNNDDNYILNNRFEIEWTGHGENFILNEYFYDREVGYVSNPDLFSGNFDQCLNKVLELTGEVK